LNITDLKGPDLSRNTPSVIHDDGNVSEMLCSKKLNMDNVQNTCSRHVYCSTPQLETFTGRIESSSIWIPKSVLKIKEEKKTEERRQINSKEYYLQGCNAV
jgi:hypothetical protein